MGQISSIPGNSAVAAQPVAVPDAAPDKETRALKQAVAASVRTLNEAGAGGDGREVTWSIDSGSRRPVVKVVDSLTREVITQWPAEYALALAAQQKNPRDY